VYVFPGGAEKDLNFRIADVKQLDFGESHMLVLKNDGRLYSWGAGTHGQLGIGAKGTSFEKEDLASSDLYLVWPLENVRVKQVSDNGRAQLGLKGSGIASDVLSGGSQAEALALT
jgi:alpha-tubulin suppressor-like RCC1 family protein